MNFVEITNGEKKRTYIFPNGKLEVLNVARICVRSSGTHRLETSDGQKWIVPTGWIGILVEADTWSL
jgi:hypothetical protein